MPQSLAVGLFVLGGVLLLVAISGGHFKIFGAEVSDSVPSGPMRLLAGALGICFIFLALSPAGAHFGGGAMSARSAECKPRTGCQTPHPDVCGSYRVHVISVR